MGSRTTPSSPPAQEAVQPRQHQEGEGEQGEELPQPIASSLATPSSSPLPLQPQQRPSQEEDREDRRLAGPSVSTVVPSATGVSPSRPVVIHDDDPGSPSSSVPAVDESALPPSDDEREES